jgi:hypothetical protein
MNENTSPITKVASETSTKLWRYMDFLKFFDLCESGQLYFSSIRGLRNQDPFEGSYTRFHTQYQLVTTAGGAGPHQEWTLERNLPPRDWNPLAWQFYQEIDACKRRILPNYIYANCWHANSNESLAMWKMYDLSGYGIGIVSSIQQLQDSFLDREKKIKFGHVNYLDYSKDEKWMGNLYDPFMHKHRAFAHEQEFRALFILDELFPVIQKIHYDIGKKYGKNLDHWMTLPTKKDEEASRIDVDLDIDVEKTKPHGIKFDVDLEKLIEYVVVSPNCQDWMFERVRDYCNNKIGKSVIISELRGTPFF